MHSWSYILSSCLQCTSTRNIFSSIQDVDIILLKEEVLKLQEQTRSQLELLKEVTTERDELKRSLEHVNARWDGKVKRLEAQLALKSVDTIAVEVFALLINLLSLYCSCMLTCMHTTLLCN